MPRAGRRVAELLLLLLNRVPGAAAHLHDTFDHRLFHTLRTPQVRERAALSSLCAPPCASLSSPFLFLLQRFPAHARVQMMAALAQRSTGGPQVLGDMCTALLAEIQGEVHQADPWHRPSSMWRPGLSQAQVHSLASFVGRNKLPGVML